MRGVLEDHRKTIDPLNPRDFVDEYVIEMERRKNDTTSTFCVSQTIVGLHLVHV